MKNILKNITIAVMFFSLLSNFSCTEKANIKGQRISEFMNYCYENNMFNGSVLVAVNSKVIYKNALGFKNLETSEPLKLTTPSNIGSVSKQFTAMGIMILKEQGLLSYNDKLYDYFPGIKFSDKITIRQLLTHTSGFPRLNSTLQGVSNMKEAYSYFLSLDLLLFNPGENYSYSNSGYILLALIIEKITGKSYNEFIKQNIFIPLKMNNTFLRSTSNSYDDIRAIGFNRFGEKYDDSGFIYGPGGIYSTVEDLFKWDQALYTEKLVSIETLREAFSPGLLNDGTLSRKPDNSQWGYGFGWLLKKNEWEDIVWHDGGINGFSSVFYRELKKSVCIVILSNKGDMGTRAPVYPIHNVILKILNEKPYEFPKIPVSLKMENLIKTHGLEKAIIEYYELKKTDADKYDFTVSQLNGLGYYFLNKQHYEEAKAIFKLNILAYPDDANTYDSYAEVCMLIGDTDEAITNYKKSLELNPGNENAKEMLEKLKI